MRLHTKKVQGPQYLAVSLGPSNNLSIVIRTNDSELKFSLIQRRHHASQEFTGPTHKDLL